VEALEGRELMSLGGTFGPINTTTRNNQDSSDNAIATDGSSVVVWVDWFSDGLNGRALDRDIRAQRYNSFGGKLGPEIVVSFSSLDESSPRVAMNDLGQFVVTWVQYVPGGDSNVVAQRFDSNGNAVGGVIQVGAGTFQETSPDVAMDRSGNFVVAYTRNTNNNNPDDFAKRYNSSGQLLQVIDVAISPVAEFSPSVAMTPDGRFDVAWEQVFNANDHDIWEKSFSASGALTGTNAVAFSTALDEFPSIAMDNAGDAVVGWQKNDDIKARRINANGSMGPEINIYSDSRSLDRDAKVALKPGGGGFVVAFDSVSFDPSLPVLVYRVAEVSAFDSVTILDAGRGADAISINFFGDYLITYTTIDGLHGPDNDIFGRRGRLLF
jgi:hypothetical protein